MGLPKVCSAVLEQKVIHAFDLHSSDPLEGAIVVLDEKVSESTWCGRV